MKPFSFLLVITLTILLIGAAGCPPKLDYEADELKMNAAIAGISEYPIVIDGKPCKDSNGEPGACLIRLGRNVPLEITIMPNPEPMHMFVVCTAALDWGIDEDVPEKLIRKYQIPISKYENINHTFYCKGNIYPRETPEAVKSTFMFFVELVDQGYEKRSTPYKFEDWLIMGKHARHVTCYEKNQWKYYSKKPVLKAENKQLCYSISYMWRINSYGI